MSSIYHCISETLDAVRIVLAFGRQDRHQQQLVDANTEYYNRSQKLVRVTALVRPVTGVARDRGVYLDSDSGCLHGAQ
jgi:ABC-type multidrug transport system fused ATPase/permease subunit